MRLNNCTETLTLWQMAQILKQPYSQYIFYWNISPSVPADSSKAPVRQEHCTTACPRIDMGWGTLVVYNQILPRLICICFNMQQFIQSRYAINQLTVESPFHVKLLLPDRMASFQTNVMKQIYGKNSSCTCTLWGLITPSISLTNYCRGTL